VEGKKKGCVVGKFLSLLKTLAMREKLDRLKIPWTPQQWAEEQEGHQNKRR